MTKTITITMTITAIMTTTITMTVSLFPAVLRRLTWEGRAQALRLPRCCRRGVPSCQYLLRPCAAHLNAKLCLAWGIVRRRLTLYRARAFFVLVVLTRGVSWIFARSPQGFMPGGSQAPDLGGIIGAMVPSAPQAIGQPSGDRPVPPCAAHLNKHVLLSPGNRPPMHMTGLQPRLPTFYK